MARASLVSYLEENESGFLKSFIGVKCKHFPCVDVAVSLLFTQRLAFFLLLYSSNHPNDVVLTGRTGILLATQTASWAADRIIKSYGGSNCRI